MLYKVIIADDEPLTLIGLKSIIPWEDHHATIAGTARNGRELWEQINTIKPDIVITDIRMPLLSGLEVMQKCADAKMHHPLFILLTGYEEFQLVKKAINLNAVEYLVKLELTPENLSSAVDKAVARLTAEHLPMDAGGRNEVMFQVLKDRLYLRFLNGLSVEKAQMQDMGITDEKPYAAVAYLYFSGGQEGNTDELATQSYSASQILQETLGRFTACHVIPLDIRHAVVLFFLDKGPKEEASVLKGALLKAFTMVDNYCSIKARGAVGMEVKGLSQTNRSFASARSNAEKTSAERPLVIALDEEMEEGFDLSPYRERLSLAINEMDGGLFRGICREIVNVFESGGVSLLSAITATNGIFILVLSMFPDGQEEMEKIFRAQGKDYRNIYQAHTVDECSSYLTVLAEGMFVSMSGKFQDWRVMVVKKVQEYIKENLDKRLSLSDVASVFGFSENYLSSLFSKYGDMGFVEYTTKVKMDKAKEMIRLGGTYKVYEMAEALGYDSAFYFSKVFKKYEGLSPRDYAQKLYGRKMDDS